MKKGRTGKGRMNDESEETSMSRCDFYYLNLVRVSHSRKNKKQIRKRKDMNEVVLALWTSID